MRRPLQEKNLHVGAQKISEHRKISVNKLSERNGWLGKHEREGILQQFSSIVAHISLSVIASFSHLFKSTRFLEASTLLKSET